MRKTLIASGNRSQKYLGAALLALSLAAFPARVSASAFAVDDDHNSSQLPKTIYALHGELPFGREAFEKALKGRLYWNTEDADSREPGHAVIEFSTITTVLAHFTYDTGYSGPTEYQWTMKGRIIDAVSRETLSSFSYCFMWDWAKGANSQDELTHKYKAIDYFISHLFAKL